LIVHGDIDPVVPFYQSELLFGALKAAGGNVHLHCIRGAEHGKGFGGKDVTEMVDAFFDRWLKASGKAGAEAVRTESAAVAEAARGNAQGGGPRAGVQPSGGRKITFERVRTREGVNGDGVLPRDDFLDK